MSTPAKNLITIVISAVLATGLALGTGLDPIGMVGELFSGSQEQASTPTSTSPTAATGTVTAVTDGDTIRVEIDGQIVPVRFVGIDAPEINWPDAEGEAVTDECFGLEARAWLKERVDGRPVWLESDPLQPSRDTYDRRLAYVYEGGELINSELVAEGYAETLVVGEGFSRQSEFTDLQTQAKDGERGLWGQCGAARG